MTDSIFLVLWRVAFALLALCLFSLPVSANDLTIFGGIQRNGQLTFQ